MEVEWHPDAREEFLKLEPETQEVVRDYKNELAEKGLKWDKVGLVSCPGLGLEAFRLKIDPGEHEEVNHRLIFDIDDQEIVIYKAGKREGFYNRENLKEAEERR